MCLRKEKKTQITERESKHASMVMTDIIWNTVQVRKCGKYRHYFVSLDLVAVVLS